MRIITLGLALALTGLTTHAQAQDKIYTSMSTVQIEQILRGLNLEFTKTASKADGVYLYDYTRDKIAVRLHYYNGKDLMLDVAFKDYPLETINRWNSRAKFSRASFHKHERTPWTVLESNLDIVGGITENNVRHFIRVFHEEIAEFDRFLGGSETAGSDKILANLTAEKLESIMKDLKLAFKKQALKDAKSHFYDYETKNGKFRVCNFGGNDLMVACFFKKVSLEAVNNYNSERKFIRAVVYTSKEGVAYTALEANQDCSAGISENMIRHFLLTFEGEAQNFLGHVNKN